MGGSPECPVEPRRVQRRFKAILKKCGLADTNFHALRHHFATRCIEKGIDAKTVSELLGHSNVSITLNRYVHPSKRQKAESLEALSDLLVVKKSGQDEKTA